VSTDELAAEIVGRCRERIDAGEDVDVDAVVRAHPEIAATLRERFDALARLDRGFRRPRDTTDAATSLLVGRLLGPWRLVSVLGAGGMGTVFLAEDGPTRVAVKVIHPHLLARQGFVARFLREADVGRRVRHENVVATLEAGTVEVNGRPVHFLVMEHVEGRTLRALADELGRVPEELCRHVGREVAKALVAMHAAGAVHRDLKPDNVLITKDHVVKVMDLGVARLTDEAMRLSQTGAFIGSVRYGAPEQFHAGGAEVDGRADLYALGMSLYELATGRHPFEGDDFRVVVRQQMTEVPRPAGAVNPQLSPFFEEVLRCLLEKDRETRFASAVALLDVLDQGEGSAWWQDRAKAIRADTRRPLRRMRIPRETALYGRDAELARLHALFDAAKAGDGRVVLVEGEAGIGKSRLVDEFVGRLAQAGEDVNFLYGSYPPGGAATVAGAFTSAYREHLGDDESAVRAALPHTPLLVSAFAALLRGDAAPAGAEPLTKVSLQTVFVHATRSFAALRTTIVLIDDLHFAPEEGRALFAALALCVPEHRILLVGTARPEIDAAWIAQVERGGHVSRIRLPRLGAKDLVLLLRENLGSNHLAEELAAKIAVKSDGNPFFVFEILRGLRDGQFLTRKPDGTWATTKVIAEIEVPETVKDLIFARVGSLATQERNLLDVAACAGFEFDPVLVGEVLHVGRIPVLQRLAAVEKSHRLVRSVGRLFAFDHHQVTEVLYAALPEMLREEYHGSIAAAIEERHGAATKEPKGLDGALCVNLAEHFLKGAQGERAIRYLEAALDHLEKRYLNDAAVRLGDRALAVPGLVEGRRRCELLLRKAGRLDLLGRRDAQRTALEEASALADTVADATLRVQARRSIAILHWRHARHDEARVVLDEALGMAHGVGDRKAEALLRGVLGVVFQYQSRYAEAREQQERVLALSREIGDEGIEATATQNLGGLLVAEGRLAEAQELVERALAIHRKVENRKGEADATGTMGSVLLAQGRSGEARENQERHLALAREIGDRQSEARAMSKLGVALRRHGRFGEAREHQERVLALAREIGDRHQEATATADLGSACLDVGRLMEAREQFEQYLAICGEIGDPHGEAVAMGNLGIVLRTLGRVGEAQEYGERDLALCRKLEYRRGEGFALHLLANLAEEAGDSMAAERFLTETLELRRAMGERDGTAITLEERGTQLARVGRADEARAAFAEALALAREVGLSAVELLATTGLARLPGGDSAPALAALASHEACTNVQDAMEARFRLWQATRDPVHLAEAKRLLDFLVEHAPPECRETMLANVRLHREIAAAAREQGLPLAADVSRGVDQRSAGSTDA
jgi:tetratricopeptide (TPR) repeat protein